ncbi:MAG: lysophospholipid acyltransferase family protein [Verrucomicrobiales bacterium]|nr:lysophospholipid acyltransferase family protein [Verrucomicrobiales bacterium]
MSEASVKSFDVKGLSSRSRRIAFVLSLLIGLICRTVRWRLHDPGNLREKSPEHPLIWVFWHNRIFILTYFRLKYMAERRGAILSSASRDGEIIAALVSRAGCASVRGSTSRRGAAALLGLLDWIKSGYDVGVVPDGPRGPVYKLGPGVIKLAGMTDAKILPVRVEYGSCWKFKSWDRFRVPKPFTTVDIYLDPLFDVPANQNDEELEASRTALERIMNPKNETD